MKCSHYLFSFILTLVFTKGVVLAAVDSYVGSACLNYENQFNWSCESKGGRGGGRSKSSKKSGYSCYCSNEIWLQSVTNCVYNATSHNNSRKQAFEYVIKICDSKGDSTITMDEIYQYLEAGRKHVIDYSPLAKIYPVNGTMQVNQTDFNWYYTKFKQYSVFLQRCQWFGWGLVFYWVFIIGITTLFNINKRMIGWKVLNKYNNFFNRQFFIPSVFKNYHDRTFFLFKFIPFDFTTRANALIIAIFVIMTMIFVGVGYNVTLPHPSFSSREQANIVLVSYRTDILSISIFPLIYFFGSRNNIFLPLTGLSYPTFLYFHKWCAYACTTLAFFHALLWTGWDIKLGNYSNKVKQTYWQWGITGTVLMFLLIFHSERVFRRAIYEIFLILHHLMSLMFIVCMHYHLKRFGWMGWVWSMIAIYSFDKFMRLVRVILHGGPIKAKLQDCSGEIMKMTVKKPKFLKYQAGSFAYIYFLSFSHLWFYNLQSHPFTVLNDPTDDPKDSKNLVFYFKAHKGITRNVLSRLLSSGEESIECTILLEGPYGFHLPQLVKPTGNTIGIAAGLGISAVYPHLYNILKDHAIPKDEVCKLVWIIRDRNCLNWFQKELFWLRNKNCEVKILITGPDKNVFVDSESSLAKSQIEENDIVKTNIDVEHLGCKPNLDELITCNIELAETQSKDITFIGCGPEFFNDQLRGSIAKNIPKNSNINIDFQSESFVW